MNVANPSPEAPPEETPETGYDSGIDPGHLKLLEAILFASTEPLSERALAYRLPEGTDLAPLLSALRDHYAEGGVNLVRAGKSWAFRTAPDLAQQLNKEIDMPRKLSRAAVETLAIIAYHQPVTRAEIEEVRGVGLSRGTLDVLLEANWIRPKGRRRTPGRPMTWGTTDGFLDHFALEDVRDLPGMDELKAAGLLDSGPAISVYGAALKKAGTGDEVGENEGAQLELIPGGESIPEEADAPPDGGLEDVPDPADPPEPLDPDDGEAEQA
jgi:segregation and condensation protein B